MLFETKEYKIEVEKQAGCQLVATVTASKECVNANYKKAIKNINKEISLPGFRKGKVPEEAVIKKYAPQVDQEWKEILLNEALRKTFELTNIYPLTKNSINRPKIQKCSLEEGAVFILSYEYYPEIPQIDFASISLPQGQIPAVTEEEINDVIEEIQESHATWEEISDRSVEEGDYVDLTIEAIEETGLKPISNKRRFQVTPKRMGEWMRVMIVGKNKDDVVEGESSADPKASDEVKAKFKKTRVKITIHSIHKANLPEVNEEFMAKVGVSSIEDLRDRIRKDLNKESEESNNERLFFEMKNVLLNSYSFDVPASLKEEEKKERLNKKIEELKKQNLPEDEIKNKEKELEEASIVEGEKALRLYFLTRQIAKQGNISVTKEDLNEELNRRMIFKDMKEIPENILTHLSNMLYDKKVKEYALSQIH